MYQIAFAQGVIEVDCRFRSYDPDKFQIYSMEWEGGITIPKCIWWNLKMKPEWKAWSQRRHSWYNNSEYIHEYIFRWLCEFEDPYQSDY